MADKEEKYTEGSLINAIWRLSWPAVTSMLLHTMLAITDTKWVGMLGKEEVAALTTSMFPMWVVFSLLMIIPTGVVAIISRAIGAGKEEEVSRVAGQSFNYAIWSGIVYCILGYIFTPEIIQFMRPEESVAVMGIAYLRIFFLGVIFFFINESFSAIFRAAGKMKVHLVATSSAVVLNIILDPLFIFGVGPFPEMGVEGAAVATIISVAFETAIYVILIKRGLFGYKLQFKLFEKLDFNLAWIVTKIGFPVSISSVSFSIVYIFLNRIVNGFGTAAESALMIGNRMESLSYMVCFGFSMAASTMVGQSLGAGDTKRAAKSAWYATGFCVLFTMGISVMFLVFPRQLASFFIEDKEVIDIAVYYLKILAISQSFMAVEIVLEGAFSGAGNTMPPTLISIPGTMLRLPLAYYFCFELNMGINGMWWAITLTTCARALVMLYWFSLGRWKKTGSIQV
ncbi:MAG: MATE family efflux transporter [candidate division Zixibacteria bacterium]|nr:MATE family efflux transporter [candidate division Zixibacteria bacterium]